MMTSKTRSVAGRSSAAGTCALLVLLCAAPLAAASTDQPTHSASAAERAAADPAEVSYSCAADGQFVGAATGVTLKLDNLPTQVTAGETLFLQGVLRLDLPAETTLTSQLQLATDLGIETSDFSLAIKDGDRVRRLTATDAVGPRQAIGSETVLEASIVFPALKVPARASGSLLLRMPTTAATRSKVIGAPDKVVFGTQLSQNSLLAPFRNLDCWMPASGSPTVVARIDIAQVNEPSPAVDGSPTPSPATAVEGDVDGALSGPSQTPPPTLGAPLPVPAPGSEPSLVGTGEPNGVASVAAPAPALVSVQIPPQTVGEGTFVPTWSLALIIAVLPATTVLYAIRQRRRLLQLVATTTTDLTAKDL